MKELEKFYLWNKDGKKYIVTVPTDRKKKIDSGDFFEKDPTASKKQKSK